MRGSLLSKVNLILLELWFLMTLYHLFRSAPGGQSSPQEPDQCPHSGQGRGGGEAADPVRGSGAHQGSVAEGQDGAGG